MKSRVPALLIKFYLAENYPNPETLMTPASSHRHPVFLHRDLPGLTVTLQSQMPRERLPELLGPEAILPPSSSSALATSHAFSPELLEMILSELQPQNLEIMNVPSKNQRPLNTDKPQDALPSLPNHLCGKE